MYLAFAGLLAAVAMRTLSEFDGQICRYPSFPSSGVCFS